MLELEFSTLLRLCQYSCKRSGLGQRNGLLGFVRCP